MKTIRDHIAGQPNMPKPPAGATHVLAWGDDLRRWELLALHAPAGDPGPGLAGGADISPAELVSFASALLGGPVMLSFRIELDGEVGYYVTLGGGR